MKKILGSVACLTVVTFAGVSVLAADGVVISQRTTSSGTTENTQVQITKDKMRAELTGTGGGKQVIIFDGTRGVIDIVNVDRRTYSELTKAQIDQMATQMQGMMSQMEAAMANMPPAQRAQVEAMMRGRMGGMGAAAPKTEYRKTGVDRVGQWTCDKYEGMLNGQKVAEVCTVDPSVIGLTDEDTTVMRELADMFKGVAAMAQQASSVLGVGRMEEQGFVGLPVRHVMTAGGRETTMELTGVARQDIADSQFQVPAGFQKQELMGGMGGRGRQ